MSLLVKGPFNFQAFEWHCDFFQLQWTVLESSVGSPCWLVSSWWLLLPSASGEISPSIINCDIQRLIDQRLKSPIFPCCCSVGNISTIWCVRPHKPYIFWKLTTPIIHWPIDHPHRHRPNKPTHLTLWPSQFRTVVQRPVFFSFSEEKI